MMFWEIVWGICQLPLGIAAVMASIIVGMVVFLICSFLCYCIWVMILEGKNEKYKIFGRKDDE